MKQKITIFSILLIVCFQSVFADPISKEKAINVANKWTTSQLYNSRKTSKKITSVEEVYHQKKLVYFVINYSKGGFVIVSADDTTKPILAYSDSNYFDIEIQNPTTKALLEAYKDFVFENAKIQKAKGTQANKGWNTILTPKATQRRAAVVPPFMNDILYTQSNGFEKYCPSNNDGQAIVGCVATAMAQVMRYWEFPTKGVGQKSYNHNKYGNLSVNFENQTYDWNNMSKVNADDENAKLSYHCGVAVSMNYGTSANGGSGAYSADALTALKKYFKYNNGASMVYRYNYSDEQWKSLLKEQLNEKRPVLYSGRSKNLLDPNAGGAGHLFVLDGYDTTEQGDYFHINWGWAGRSNGYFYLTEMITHGGKYNWIDNNAIMINVYPTNVAPLFTSKPINTIRVNSNYTYPVTVIDENQKDSIQVSLTQAPSWLSLSNNNGTYILQGTAPDNATGSHKISITATDGVNTSVHEFSLLVLANDDVLKTTIIDFETNDFSQGNFQQNASTPFSIVNNNNHYAQNNTINDNQEATLVLNHNFKVATTVTFDYFVSSESNYDFLIFKIDGQEQQKWSGEHSWNTFSTNISAGNHVLTWSYKKDASTKKGLDVAGIDNITYQTITKDTESPGTPTGVIATTITNNSVLLSWNASTDNGKIKAYEIYKNNVLVGTAESLQYEVTNLTANSNYTFAVKAVDYANNTSEMSLPLNVKTLDSNPTNYCISKGNNTHYEWIQQVSLSDMINNSGENKGYGNFTSLTATVTSNKTYELSILPGFSNSAYKEYYNIWIDYNQNGVFEQEENVATSSSSGKDALTFQITIPAFAKLGKTRMRVSMKYNSTSTPCELFNDGEVEDYTINIIQTSARLENKKESELLSDVSIILYPNPVSKELHIKSSKKFENASFEIINSNGKIIKQGALSSIVNVESLSTGAYFIKIYGNGNQYSSTFIKANN